MFGSKGVFIWSTPIHCLQQPCVTWEVGDGLQSDSVGLYVPRWKVQHAAVTTGLGIVHNFRQLLGFAQLSADGVSARNFEWLYLESAQPFADLCRDVHLESLNHLFCKNFG